MFSLSSPLALKGQLKLSTATTVLLVVFIFTLCVTSCKARHLRVNVHGKHSSKLTSSSPPKVIDVIEVGATKEKMRPSMAVRAGSNIDASMGKEVMAKVKKEVALSGDSSRGSVRKRFEGIKARSGMRERPVLGAESNSEQLGSNATTAYTAETLVAMDYLDAHPAPAVHNR
ncbi:uncharacterized protein LOC133922929 [Phragmites australis]|uniref:uncharacterized protein LOC133922929 n=1 Tax=Phragmites australis TaxID=29695 RepID=UPI002D76F613|nr:uncharacterized protein LOC133922929 [Phragmites australis]